MKKALIITSIVACAGFNTTQASAAKSANPYIGHWALTLEDGRAGWLGISGEKGELKGGLLMGGGSVVPVLSVKVDGDRLVIERKGRGPAPTKGKGAKGKTAPPKVVIETIAGSIEDGVLNLTYTRPKVGGKAGFSKKMTGIKTPPIPKKPNLKKVKYGKPIELFNGKNLDGWRLTDEKRANGWSAIDGVLSNDPVQPKGKHVSFGNLRTDAEFEDFKITFDVQVPEKGNSGVYLRGIYEIQISDSFGLPLDSHNMGGLYSRVSPTVSAEKKAGEWQSMELTLIDRHITVVLNGQTIIDNQPALGCTGGALSSDVMAPGPIYLQGDHKAVKYRNIVLTPVK